MINDLEDIKLIRKPELDSVPCSFCDEFVVFEKPSYEYINAAFGVCSTCNKLSKEEKETLQKKEVIKADFKLIRARLGKATDVELNLNNIKFKGCSVFFWELIVDPVED